MPFFTEFDTGSERLEVLIDKTAAYQRLAKYTAWRWPVLFWLPNARRERNLHHALAGRRFATPIVTAAADLAAAHGLSPAEEVWWLIGRHHDDGRLRLAQLPYADPALAQEPEGGETP